jgi:prepilin-type N-terminal cleavage/methylation domain-containing protein
MKRSRGFTLIELLVAVIIIAIASIESLEFFKYCYSGFVVPDELKLEAINYTAGSMEQLYMEDPNSPSLAVTSSWVDDGLITAEGKLSLDNRKGKKSHSIATVNSGEADEYKLIKTKVTWTQ